jgi:hypothetical protein
MTAMSFGDVCLFDLRGQFLYKLNTHKVYEFPKKKIRDAIENNIY